MTKHDMGTNGEKPYIQRLSSFGIMHVKMLSILLLTATLLAPATTAQDVPQGITVEPAGADEARTISADGTTTIPYTVTVGCAEFINEGSQTITVSLDSDLPDYYGASSDGITFEPSEACIVNSGFISGDVDLTLTPTADALGLNATTYTVTATAGADGASNTYEHTEKIQIEYVGGHTLETDIDFPYTYTQADDGSVEFTMYVNMSANSKSMVMWEQVGFDGSLNGIQPNYIFDIEGGETQNSWTLTWTPPSGAWENATISFYNYSHTMKGTFEEIDAQNVEWVITNGMPGAGEDPDAPGEDSPGLPMLGVGLALLGIAMVLRRR